MPRAYRKYNIAFGLVNIPVSMTTLAKDNSIRGKMLDPETLTPVQQVFKTQDGRELTRGETVIGYETEAGFVTLTEDDRIGLLDDHDKSIALEAFCNSGDVDPIYYEASYMLWPQDIRQATGYDLLAQALRKTKRVAVGRVFFTKSDRMAVIRWSDATECLIMHLCHFEAEIRWSDTHEIAEEIQSRKVDKQHVAVATQLVEALFGPFQPSAFQDEYTEGLKKLIDAKTKGMPISRGAKQEAPAQIPNIIEALRASIAEMAA